MGVVRHLGDRVPRTMHATQASKATDDAIGL